MARNPRTPSDAELERVLHERAYAHGCDFIIERTELGWMAAYKVFDPETAPSEMAPRGVILFSAEAPERRDALEALLANDALDEHLADRAKRRP